MASTSCQLRLRLFYLLTSSFALLSVLQHVSVDATSVADEELLRQEARQSDVQEPLYPIGRLLSAKRAGRWAKNNLQAWGKREQDGQFAGAPQRHGWVRNNLKIWGKRSANAVDGGDQWRKMHSLLRGLFLGFPADVPEATMVDRRAYVEPEDYRDDYALSSYGRLLSKREDKEEAAGVPEWGKKGWASNNVRIWG